ncbi:MAG: DCC1-like thiol-disulfide oxidoreductase family protein, partial [Opitutae bacterium]
LKKEKSKEIRFAPLQSDTGKKLLQKYGYPDGYLDGLIYIENERAYNKSSACLRIAGQLKFPWNLFTSLLLIPRPFRDWIYQIIAGLRYRWFGKKESCALPEGQDTSRFL